MSNCNATNHEGFFLAAVKCEDAQKNVTEENVFYCSPQHVTLYKATLALVLLRRWKAAAVPQLMQCFKYLNYTVLHVVTRESVEKTVSQILYSNVFKNLILT